jgi:iron complex outermembrane receptor protein
LSTGWSHPVDKKSLQIQKLEHILVARIEWIRAEYALGDFTAKGLLSYVNGQNIITGDNLYQIMPINMKLSLEQKMDGWTNSVEAQFVSANANVSQVRNEIETGAYALFNLRSSYEWNNIRVDAGIDNILDTLYYLPLGGAYIGQGTTIFSDNPGAPPWGIAVPGMGRSFYVATRVKFRHGFFTQDQAAARHFRRGRLPRQNHLHPG